MRIFSYLFIFLVTICGQAYADSVPFADVIVDPGVKYSAATRSWQGIPGVERSRSGRLWATWYSGDAGEGNLKNYALLSTSGDQGRTWSAPTVVIQGGNGVRVNDPLPWLDPKGRLWVFYEQLTHRVGAEDQYDCFAIRTDEPNKPNPKWTAPFLVAEGGILFGKPIVRSDGGWVAPFFIIGKPSWIDQIHGKETGTLVSTDEGGSWKWLGGTTIPEKIRSFSEATIAQRKDGSLWMVIRTMNGLYNSTSNDGGHTWSDAIAIPGFKGPASRACMKKLKSGSYVLIYNDSLQRRKREKLTAWISDDEGRTWGHKLLLDERQEVSYPDATQAPDGRIFIAYDHGRYSKGEKQILLSIIREEDIRAEKNVSNDSQTKIVVNEATGSGNSFDLHHMAPPNI